MQSEILFAVDNHVTSLEISTKSELFPSTQIFRPCNLLLTTGKYGSYMATWGFPASTAVGVAWLASYGVVGRSQVLFVLPIL